jgi:hypothetical protein
MMNYKIIESRRVFKDKIIIEIARFEQVSNAIDFVKFYFKKNKHISTDLKIDVIDMYTNNNVFALE